MKNNLIVLIAFLVFGLTIKTTAQNVSRKHISKKEVFSPRFVPDSINVELNMRAPTSDSDGRSILYWDRRDNQVLEIEYVSDQIVRVDFIKEIPLPIEEYGSTIADKKDLIQARFYLFKEEAGWHVKIGSRMEKDKAYFTRHMKELGKRMDLSYVSPYK